MMKKILIYASILLFTGCESLKNQSSDDEDSFMAAKPKNELEKKGYIRLTQTERKGSDNAFESGGSAGLIEDKQCDDIIQAFTEKVRKISKSQLVIKRLPLGMIMYTDTGKDVFTYLMIFPSGVLGAAINERSQDGDPFSCVKDGEYYAGILKIREE